MLVIIYCPRMLPRFLGISNIIDSNEIDILTDKHNQKKVSQRKKSIIMSSNDETSARSWTKEERRKLLELVKIYGHTNYDRIALEFPNKSPLGIKAKINKYLSLSKSLKPGSVDPLDFWLYSFFQPDEHSLISRALLYIQLFENHPPTDESDGIQFDTIYGLLHRLTLGHPPNNISPKTFDAFDKEMVKAIEFVACKSEKEVLTYLSTLNIKKKPTKDYTRKTS